MNTLAAPSHASPTLRNRVARGLRAAWIISGSTLTILFAIEFAIRLFAGGVEPGSDVAARGPKDVVYDLHPYFQTIRRSPWGDKNPQVVPGWWVLPEGNAFDEGRRRIFFIGGSTTATMYPEYVRAGVESKAGPTSAFAVAHDWHCSLHSLYKFWTYFDLIRPDLVVVLDNVNDFVRGFTPPDDSLPDFQPDYSHHAGALFPFWKRGQAREDGAPAFYARPHEAFGLFDVHDDTLAGWWKSLQNESALFRALRARVSIPVETATIVEPMSDDVMLRALPSFERNLQNLARSARAKGVPIVFLTMPFTLKSGHNFRLPSHALTNDDEHFPDDASIERALRRFNDAVRALDGYEGAHVIDLEPLLTDPALFRDEVHFVERGEQLEGKAVVDALFAQRILIATK